MKTVEESRVAGIPRSVTSVFCAHVGLVTLEATGSSEDGPSRETAVLKAFGPRVNLTSTDVTDAAIDEILLLPSVRTLCLGNVAVTPEAIGRLKQYFKDHDRKLSLGYTQKK